MSVFNSETYDPSNMSPEERKKRVRELCFKAGAFAAVKVLAVSVPAVVLAVRYSPGFRKWFGTSGRTAIAIMPPLAAFGAVSEQQATVLSHPEVFRAAMRKEVDEKPIAFHHKVANYVYFHPFNTIVTLAVPTVLGIFVFLGGEEHFKFSQRVMHTRVLGQASVLAILAGTMAFHDYMDRRGPYSS